MQRIASLLLVLVIFGAPSAAAADAFVIVNQAEADARIVQASGDALRKCIPFYTAALGAAPGNVEVYIYPSREAFARGLQTRGSFSASAAAGWARTAYVVEANSNDPIIFVSQERVLELAPQDVVQVMCIAVGIITERQLAGARRVSGHQWVREGYSRFMAARALDTFGLQPFAVARDRATRALAQMQKRGQAFPTLEGMRTLDGWQAVFERYGAGGANAFAFVAVDLLMRQTGAEAFVQYFKGLAYRVNTPPDIDGAYQTAFTTSVGQFQTELNAYLGTLVK